jgi:hypothetical protein
MTRSLQEILDQDAATRLDDDDFDHEVFCALFDRISSPRDVAQFSSPVGFYFASRLVQNDVCNGGFAQAAFNMPEWFELAAAGYRALGKHKSARSIEEVKDLLGGNEEAVRQLRADETKWEEYFGDHVFQVYDQLVFDSDDWEVDPERIAYLRANRDAFKI